MSSFLKVIVGASIVLFWGIMTGWLVKANWNDGNAPFSDVSPAVVLGQVLKHEISSQLGIYQGRRRIGAVTITPIHSPQNSVSFDGNISIAQEHGKPQLMNFSIRVDLIPSDFRPAEISIRLRRREPSLSALIEVLLKEQKVRYDIQNGEFDMGRQEMPLSADAFALAIPALTGFPLPIQAATFTHTLEARANRATIRIRGERMDGFRVKMGAAGVTATATLGQLGELFILRTSTEYQLLADGLEPDEYLR